MIPFVLVPTFVQELTGSELMVGVMSALRVLAITLPQAWAASVLVARPRKKPLLAWSSIGGRLPVLFLALATLLWAGNAPWAVVAVLTLAVASFFTSEGLNSISWPDLVGKVIPAHIRGRFLGLGQLLSSLGALGAGYAVRLILSEQGPAYPLNWTIIFGLGFVGLILSVVATLFVREEPGKTTDTTVSVRRSIAGMAQCLREDARLRRAVLAQLAMGLAASTFPFFIIRAGQLLSQDGEITGTFLMIQNVGGILAALICGYLIDRTGSRIAVRVSTSMQCLALSAAIAANYFLVPQVLYGVAFLLLGFVVGSSWWTFSAYLLEIASDEQRPTYLAAYGILTSSPVFLGSLAVGSVFARVQPEALFAVALSVSLVGLSIAWSMAPGR
jgi:MFS family permease